MYKKLFLLTMSITFLVLMTLSIQENNIDNERYFSNTIFENRFDYYGIDEIVELKKYCEDNNMKINIRLNPQSSCINN